MSEADTAGGAAAPSGGERDKRAWAEEVLAEILRLMGISARLEVKELPATAAADGKAATQASISVAVFPEGEAPGLQPGKRSPVADALQFLTNKIVNRGADKRWINIGIGAHPEPRGEKQPRQQQQPQQQAAQAPAQKAAAAPQASGEQAQQPSGAPVTRQEQRQARGQKQERGAKEGGGKKEKREGAAPRERGEREGDERTLEVEDDPVFTALGRSLAEKAATFGRIYAVLPCSAQERAKLAKGAAGVAEVSVKFEGEGRHRRIAFVPANPKPMPKKSAMPDYDDEEDLDEE